MAAGSWLLAFTAGVAVILAASWLLVFRLERLGERAGFPEAWLGLVAAVAADAPEITSAVTALARGQAAIGAGVVIGSNVFNLAALLGLAAVVAGRIAVHRRVVLLAGLPAVWVAAACLLTVAAVVPPAAWAGWLVAAVHEEETELAAAIRPRRGTWADGLAAAAALAAVIGASIVMEQAATVLGRGYQVADIITGALVLAVVTSLPNAVAAVYLARRGRGAGVLSTALNSNAINVTAGLLIPASLTGSAHGPAGSRVQLPVSSWGIWES